MRCGDLIDVGAASLRLPHLKPPGVGVGGVRLPVVTRFDPR